MTKKLGGPTLTVLLFSLITIASRSRAENEIASWEFVRGGFKHVSDLSVVGPSDMWGAGIPGIFHFDGMNWKLTYENPFVISLEMTSDGTGWASTPTGFLRYDGTTWHSVLDLGPVYVTDIELLTPYDGWAIALTSVNGKPGARLLRLHEGHWIDTEYKIVGDYSAIGVVDFSNVWLVGASGIARFDGNSLSLVVLSEPGVELRDVSFANSLSGWAVGGACDPIGEQRRVVLRYEGRAWKTILDQRGGGILQKVVALSDTDAIAGDNLGQVVRISDDTPIMDITSPYPSRGENCVGGIEALTAAPNERSVIVGGTSGGPFGEAYIMRFLDEQLTLLHGRSILRLDMVSNRKGWALANGAVLQYDEDHWTTMPEDPAMPPTNSRYDIAATMHGLILAGGKGTISEYDGAKWRQYRTSESDIIYRIIESIDGKTLALGIRHIEEQPETFVLRHDAMSGEWVEDVVIRNAHGEDIDAIDGSDVWVVGQDGFVLHGSSGHWVQQDLQVPSFIRSVSLNRESGGWAVTDGDILTLRSGVWNSDERIETRLRTGLENLGLESVHTVSATDAWAVGTNSNILHFHDSMWQYDRKFGQNDGWIIGNLWQMNDVDVVLGPGDKKTVWVVGDSETIMRREYGDEVAEPTTAIGTPPHPHIVYLYLPCAER